MKISRDFFHLYLCRTDRQTDRQILRRDSKACWLGGPPANLIDKMPGPCSGAGPLHERSPHSDMPPDPPSWWQSGWEGAGLNNFIYRKGLAYNFALVATRCLCTVYVHGDCSYSIMRAHPLHTTAMHLNCIIFVIYSGRCVL